MSAPLAVLSSWGWGKFRILFLVLGFCTLTALAGSALAIPAFSGAEGFGANATGGRGGDVYHVTSLDDSNTPGTLRYGINSAGTAGRTIVFDVSGMITLTSNLIVKNPNITIAGQTAPGQGICFKNYSIDARVNNLVIRHLHSRLGIDASQESDSIDITGGSDVIIDHCSASWSVDETLSVSDNATSATVQYCYITESLNNSIHTKGSHGYGSLLRTDVDCNLSFHHNLYADHNSRNPRPGTYYDSLMTLDFRNNVIYNWGNQAGYSGSDGNEYVNMNYVGNYLVAGPSTSSSKLSNAFGGGSDLTTIFQSDNKIDPNRDGNFNGANTDWGMFNGVFVQAGSSFSAPAVYTQTADEALTTVLTQAGAFNWNRDAVDANVTSQVLSAGTEGRIYNTVAEAGDYPTYPVVTRDANFDTDGDGMPDAWEQANGLNPGVQDHNGDFDNDGYTNLEEYLTSLAPIPPPKPIVWLGGSSGTAGRYELITNWDIPWQPTLADQAEINSGKATVGYIGQEAGTLYVANTPGGSAELSITAGKLTVGDSVHLGSAAGAQGLLTLTGGSLTATGPIILASGASSTGELKVAKDAYVEVGGLTINSGGGRSTKVLMELDANGPSLIRATGGATLEGELEIQQVGSFRPNQGEAFTLILAASMSGDFNGILSNIPGLLLVDSNDPNLGYWPAFRGEVDADADYVVTFQGAMLGDAGGDNEVGGTDLIDLAAHWGSTSGMLGPGRLCLRWSHQCRRPGRPGCQLGDDRCISRPRGCASGGLCA